MKFLVQQLQKYRKNPLVIDDIIDLSGPVKENFSDRILDLKPVKVDGEISYGSNDRITVDLKLNGVAYLPSARSLAPVKYPFKINMDELYVQDEESLSMFSETEAVFLIEKNQLDLDAAILENIVTNLPMTVFKEDETADRPVSGQGWQIIKEEDYEPNDILDTEKTHKLGDFFPKSDNKNKDK